ncbi:MAG: tandem-95 repeat protein [Micrococcales bacterium]|nr:tandem-95 repeat protein [Micrococcales bacterium]
MVRGLSRGRKALASVVVIAVAAGVPVTFAILHQGFPVTDVDLASKDVWVTNGAKQLAGRLNRQIEELDGSAQATSGSIDLLQNGDDVFLENRSRRTLERIDPAYTTLGQRADIPQDAELSFGGSTIAVVDPSDGALWTVDVSNQLAFDPRTQRPDLRLGVGGHAAVTPAGAVKAVSATRDRLYTLDRPGALPRSVPMAVPARSQLAVVGDTAVVLDPARSRLIVENGPTTELPAPGLALQQSGAKNSFAVVAGRDRVFQVPLAGGSVTQVAADIPDAREGNGVIAPVFLDGCVHAAWADSQRYLLACAGRAPVKATIEQKTAGDELAFRVNRNVIALNNLDTGNVWLLSNTLRLVDNWDEITPPKEQESQETSKEKSSVQSFEDTLVKRTQQNRPPTANPDRFGVRPGRTTILSVLDNDTDPDGDVLVITDVTALPAEIGRLDPIDGSRALQFTPGPAAAGSASFRYTVSDGRPNGTAETTADVRVVPNDQNSAPAPQPKANAAVSVESGQSITYNVIRDFIDPDGDEIFLAGADATSADQVRWAPDGTVTFQHTSGEVGEKQVAITVSDGRATAQGTLKIDVKPAGSLNPVGTPDYAAGFTGDTVQVDPLQNDLSPSGAPLRLLGVKEAPGSATVVANTDTGTIAVTAQSPGAVYIQYSLGAGASSSLGLIRIDIARPPQELAPPVPVKDTAFLREGQSTEIRPLDNDVSPSGGVLAIQSVDTSSTQGSVKVEVLNNTVIRVSSSAPLSAQSQFTYTVSDGRNSAVAGVTVVPVPPIVTRQPPVAVDDRVTVRAGDIATVPVLENDYHPDQEALILDPRLPATQGVTNGGIVFAAGDTVRFQAPQQAGEYTASYRVRDQFGESATANVGFTVTPKDPKSNRPPAPLPQTARTFAGSKVRIDIPLNGIDPDGDSVTLVDYTAAPTLGRIIRSASNYFVYEAYQNSAGTDSVRYAVQDSLGATAVGEVRIGVIPRPKESSPPHAVDDQIQVKPGKTVSVQPLLNDSDPNGYPLTLQKKLLEVDTALAAKVDGTRVLIRAPKKEQTYSIRYRIDNGNGGAADAFILVRVTRDAPTLYPSAQDYYVQTDQLKKRSSYTVDVAPLIFNPNGEDRDLVVTTDGPNGKLGSAQAQRITVQAQDQRVAIAYTVTDPANPGLSATAFIIVPPRVQGDYFPAPYLDPRLPEQVVPMNAEKSWNLEDILIVPSGRPATLTDLNGVSATGGDGSKLSVDKDTIRFSGAKGFRGATALVFTVTDGDGPNDPTGRTAIITMPLTVGNPDQSDVPPSFTSVTVPVQAGEAATSVDLRAATTHPNRGVIGQFQYSRGTGFTDRIRGGLSGSELTVSAIQGTPVGTTAVITFEIRYRDFVVPGTVRVVTVPSTRPRAQANTDEVKAQRAKPVSTNVLTNDYNPFADQGTPLKLVSAKVDNAAESAAQVTSTPDGEVTVRAGSSFIGVVSITYTVQDATGDRSRNVDGRLLVTVRDVPEQMQPVQIVREGDQQVDIAWRTPTTNGEPILDYTVSWTGGGSKTFPASAAAATITGLRNGAAYQFQVTARNVLGSSTASGTSAKAVPYGTPFPPGSPRFSATAPDDGTGSMTLQWSPSEGNGRAVDSYRYSITGGALVSGAAEATVSGATTSVTVRGHVGTTYSFSVSATGPGGTSTSASSTNQSRPRPNGPPTVTATGSGNGSGAVKVTWGGVKSTEPVTYTIDVEGGPQNLTRTGNGSDTFTSSVKDGSVTVKVSAQSGGLSAGSASDTAANSTPSPSGAIVGKGDRKTCSNGAPDCNTARFTVQNIPSGVYSVTLDGSNGSTTTNQMSLSDGGTYQTGGWYGTVTQGGEVLVRIAGPRNFTISISAAKWNSF